jgi:alpha-beta hydrolase superfamily lysophospholipase
MLRARVLIAACLAVAGLAILPSAQAEGPTVIDGCIESVPEPGTTDPVPICYSIHRPAGADADHPVPMVFHSHGWGGSRTKAAGSFASWLDAGFAVLSFDQRGFGESGGKAHVEHPDFEGKDVQGLVDLVAASTGSHGGAR